MKITNNIIGDEGLKIKIEKWIINREEYEDMSYKITRIDKCCDKLIQSKNISINNEFCEDDNYEGENEYAVKFVRLESNYYSDDYPTIEHFYEKINHCPFCGEKIEMEFINTVDKSEEYKSLSEERDNLRKKCRKTDSKKKERELDGQIRELDKKINYISQNDDFDKFEEE